jgi:hypothetical protein
LVSAVVGPIAEELLEEVAVGGVNLNTWEKGGKGREGGREGGI